MSVALVCMPLCDPVRPSLALGALKSCLVAGGIEAKVRYSNMWFLDYLGLEDYAFVDQTPVFEALVDWMFAPLAFPDHRIDDDAFLARFARRMPALADRWPRTLAPRLMEIKASLPGFLDWTVERVLAERPRVVGCTSTFQQHVASLAFLRALAAADPSIITVMGGANCESVMGRATHRNFPWIDYVVSGEAEEIAVPLFRLALDRGRDASAAEVPEAVFAPVHRRTGYPTIAKGDGAPRATVKDMTRLPEPDFDDYFAELSDSMFRDRIIPAVAVETSRGCWWGQKNHCTFCGLNGGGMEFRSKSPARAIAEISGLAAKYGVRNVETVDNIIDMAYFDAVLPALEALPDKLNLFYETKSNLKRAHVERLAGAGVRWIQPGIESLSTDILKLMRKGTTAAQNIQLIRLCRQLGVRVSWAILAGFPDERDKSYAQMAAIMPALVHLQYGSFIPVLFERYSPYHTRAAEYGITLAPSEPYRDLYPIAEDQLRDLVYYFEAEDAPELGRNIVASWPAHRPATRAVDRLMRAWRKRWEKPPFPRLHLRATAHGFEVEDTRFTAPVRHALSALDVEILDAADDAPGLEKLLRRTWTHARSPAEAGAALDRLIERQLVLSLDDRIVPLVLRDPVPDFPHLRDFPGGFLFATPPGRDEPAANVGRAPVEAHAP
ncbi:MAG: RiPP maturation radical SAM protein 1 [Alphaproteobacteria bacterium]|nr:RiPP maturation radical SAM protein 1 [Alphaproteobacteria bacterium]